MSADALVLARRVVAAAAALLARARDNVGAIRNKGNARDLVTEWDTRVEELIRDRLAAETPHIPLLAEEGGESGGGDGASSLRWVVDPIDGTVNFAHGLPFYSICVSLEDAGRAVAGVVRAPALGWEFYGHRGGGGFVNGEPLRVSQVETLESAVLATGFPYDRATNPDNNFREWEHFQRRAGACRRYGAASLDLCMVARGWFDGYWERRLNAWDLSAGALLVEEAGGRVTSPTGGPFESASGAAVASNGAIHDQLVEELAAVSTAHGS